MKKILVLGAMQMHIPLLKRAKEKGYYIHTSDYIIENEGHKYADEAHYDSTTDFNAILKLAETNNVDAVLTFNSDPAALTAAYVSERLNLPTSGYDAVKIMSEKDLFRDFLSKNKFNVPKYKRYTSFTELSEDSDSFNFPLLIKPVDSSGSKGVSIVYDQKELAPLFELALSFSRCKRVIVEEYIEALHAQLHGDAFVRNNKIEFIYLGDHHFNTKINGLVPYSTTFPSQHRSDVLKQVEAEVQRFISLVGFKQGGINIEIRISAKENKIYIIEIGPRNGGNFTPIVIQYASGFNFIDAVLDCSLGIQTTSLNYNKQGYFAYLIPHIDKEGLLEKVILSPQLEEKVVDKYIYVKENEKVHSFRGANAAIGVLLVEFNSWDEMNYMVDHFEEFYTIKLKE